MKSEGNPTDIKVKELADVLAEIFAEEVFPGEGDAQSDLVKQMQEELQEESKHKEAETVEEPIAEVSEGQEEAVEENIEEQPQGETKKSRKMLIAILCAVAVVGVLAGIYFGISMRYRECFLIGTTVNGTDCSGMTIDEVGKILQKQVEDYVLTIEGVSGTTEEIKGTDIGIVYNGYHQLEEAFEEQNSYTWPKALFVTSEITAKIDFDYDSEKLNEKIAALECLKEENQTAAVSATVVYQNGEFVIQNETYGTQIDTAKLSEAIHASVTEIESILNLDASGCYLQPMFKADSAEVIAAKDEMNKYLTASITYSLDNIVVTVDKSQTYQWISVDENMTPVISQDGVKAFAQTLGNQYNTADRAGEITTPTGKVAGVAIAGYGRVVGTDAETTQLINEIKEGKTVTREPIFSRAQTPEGQTAWGTTYVEVDITEQHLWYIVNGQIALETDVVTGLKGSDDTPTGTYTIIEKMRNKTLRGRIVNGKPLYLTPVSYWMRITWSGIGFHDATWQPTFGGDRYVTNGSHGCINMPLDMAAALYEALPMGTPVVIHY